jgi:hypothetical protein
MTEHDRPSRKRGRQGERRITPKDTRSNTEGKSAVPNLCSEYKSLTPTIDSEDEYIMPSAPLSLQEIGITEYLEQDSRPTFVLDLQSPEVAKPGVIPWSVMYCNKSLRFFDELRNVVLAETFFPGPPSPISSTTSQASTSGADVDFKEWATSNSDFKSSRDGYLPRHTFKGSYSLFLLPQLLIVYYWKETHDF